MRESIIMEGWSVFRVLKNKTRTWVGFIPKVWNKVDYAPDEGAACERMRGEYPVTRKYELVAEPTRRRV